MAIYYTPSGKAPVTGILFALAVSAVFAVICAFAYCYGIWYIPIIYLNLVLIIGVPIALSVLIARVGIKFGKIRNKIVAGVIGLAGGVMFFVVQWLIHCVMVANSGEVHSIGSGSHSMGFAETGFSMDAFMFYLTNPAEAISFIGIINDVGTWGIGSGTVSGILLTIFWIVEALCILFIPVFFPWKQADNPFSEKLNQWLAERKLSKNMLITNSAGELRTEIESGNFATLINATASIANPFRRLVLYSDDQQQEVYLTVKHVALSYDDKGKEKEEETDEVKEVLIPKELYERLVAQFG
ncbi:MAG: hypothetical protein ACRC3B_07460 [Bacteroidia bacterium]